MALSFMFEVASEGNESALESLLRFEVLMDFYFSLMSFLPFKDAFIVLDGFPLCISLFGAKRF